MFRNKIIQKLKQWTNQQFIELVDRGNTAINASFSIIPKGSSVLIPEEGGWIHYHTAPKQLGLNFTEVKCVDAKIDLVDLKQKLETKKYSAFLYQNPGGYFAEQPMAEIYELCKEHNCLLILDASGSVGTKLCDGRYADILFASFRKWKVVEAGVGGFISTDNELLWNKIKTQISAYSDEAGLEKIWAQFENLAQRIEFLLELKQQIVKDLSDLDLVYPNDLGFVQCIKFSTDEEKERIINYCKDKHLEWTECPRYIRLNCKAICIEIKRRLK